MVIKQIMEKKYVFPLSWKIHLPVIVFLQTLIIIPIAGLILEIAQKADHIFAYAEIVGILLLSLAFAEWVRHLLTSSFIAVDESGFHIFDHGKNPFIRWEDMKTIKLLKGAQLKDSTLLLITKNGQELSIKLAMWGQTNEDIETLLGVVDAMVTIEHQL